MAEEACLILIKPDGLVKSITGNILNELSIAKLKIIGAKVVSANKELAEKHYSELKESKPEIFEEVLKYFMGEYHTNRILAMIYHGEDAISKIRKIVGATDPEEAEPTTIRGRYGRINSKTHVLENCVHASDSLKSAEKEIKLWFSPEEIVGELFPVENKNEESETKMWK
jgi:nucleoside-diphosphate kinase